MKHFLVRIGSKQQTFRTNPALPSQRSALAAVSLLVAGVSTDAESPPRVEMCAAAAAAAALLVLLCGTGLAQAQAQARTQAAAAAAATAGCLVVRDAVFAGQDIKFEKWGVNAVRARAVPAGSEFSDSPDVVSALVPPTSPVHDEGGPCPLVELGAAGTGQAAPPSLTNGNLKASVGPGGKISFSRISDGAKLLTEKSTRALVPTTTVPHVAGFLALDLAFEAVEGERIYGLGQHAAFSWDPLYPAKLDQKGVPSMLLEPHDGDITIPVAHSSLGYAFLSNLPSTGSVEYNATGSFWRHDAVLQMDMWIATTSDSAPHAVSPWQQLQSAYADATGHAPGKHPSVPPGIFLVI
jgi:hypothetical protein